MTIQFQPRDLSVFDTCYSIFCLDSIIKADPSNLTALLRYGQLYQAKRNFSEAINKFTSVIEHDSTFSEGYVYRDRANCKNNLLNDTGAVNDMNEAIKLNPEERYFYVDRAQYLYNLEMFELALKDYDKALQIWDKHTPARIGRAKILVVLNRYNEAKTEYIYLTDTTEISAYDYYFRGVARFQTNDMKGACEDWNLVSKQCIEAKDSADKYCRY